MRQPSRFTRTLRSLTAFLAVWCLGCSAYDPLIDALLPGSDARAMVCAADESVDAAVDASSGSGDERAVGGLTSERDGQGGATCGCDSCYAPAAPSVAVALPPGSLPQQPSAGPRIPPSADRTPLVPPPQRVA